MGNIEIKYAEVERPIVGIELNGRDGKINLYFIYGKDKQNGNIPDCEEAYLADSRAYVFQFGFSSDGYSDYGHFTLPQMEALRDAIDNMVKSIKGE